MTQSVFAFALFCLIVAVVVPALSRDLDRAAAHRRRRCTPHPAPTYIPLLDANSAWLQQELAYRVGERYGWAVCRPEEFVTVSGC